MKNQIYYILLPLIILTAPLCTSGQSQDTLTMHKSRIYSGGEPIFLKRALNLMKPYEDAYAEMSKARVNYDAANIFGFIGGFLIGWPIGTAIGGGDPNWILAGAGVGAIAIAIPLTSAGNKRARRAVELYNARVNATAYREYELRLGTTKNGFGLQLTF
ncbi:MAG: hypothetical protein RIF33_08410 [Cyclobacteriaceae bacterium]